MVCNAGTRARIAVTAPAGSATQQRKVRAQVGLPSARVKCGRPRQLHGDRRLAALGQLVAAVGAGDCQLAARGAAFDAGGGDVLGDADLEEGAVARARRAVGVDDMRADDEGGVDAMMKYTPRMSRTSAISRTAPASAARW
jgi:hypothetical protein